MAGSEKLTLTPWLHPSMQVPFAFNGKDHPIKIKPDLKIVDLMEECEQVFEDASVAKGSPQQLQISVLWNLKDHKKALNPNDKVSLHFANEDTFGAYGDIQPLRPAARAPEKSETEKIPVTILTGFLGSGKTTLLNYILQEQKDRKLAIIENEFGEISIDDALLKQEKLSMAEKIVVMDNGCMCCTIRGDLENGLMGIIDDIKKGSKIDGIMIETTGMADPVPIVRTFMSNQQLTQDLRLDAVIAMADAKHIIGRLDDNVEEGKVNEAYQQVAFSDKIILNKLDLITPEAAISVKDRIRSINKFARIVPAVRGRVKMAELSDIRAHDMAHFVDANIDQEAEEAEGMSVGHGGHGDGHSGDGGHGDDCKEEHGHGGHGEGHSGHGGHSGHSDQKDGHGEDRKRGHGHGHDSAAKKSRHDSRVNSFAAVREGEIVPQRLSAWMQTVGQLPAEKGTIFRIKAILAVKGHPFKHVFHAVMDISDEDDAGPWAPGEKKISKIVFIGKGMDEAFLRAGFDAIFE